MVISFLLSNAVFADEPQIDKALANAKKPISEWSNFSPNMRYQIAEVTLRGIILTHNIKPPYTPRATNGESHEAAYIGEIKGCVDGFIHLFKQYDALPNQPIHKYISLCIDILEWEAQ